MNIPGSAVFGRWAHPVLRVIACLGLLAVSAPAQIVTPLPQEPVVPRSAPVYSNPGVAVRPGVPQTGRLPQGALPQGAIPQAGRTDAASSTDLSRRVPVGSNALPGGFGQSKAYYYMTHPQEVPTNSGPAAPSGSVQAMLGGRVLSTGQDDIILTLLKMPRYYDAELRLITPEPRLLGSNFSAGAKINLGRLPAGEIVFGLKVSSTGLIYPTGPGMRNPDGMPHVVVQNGGTKEAPLVYLGFEDVMTANTANRQFNDAVVQLSGGVVSAILAPAPASPPPAAPAASVKKKR